MSARDPSPDVDALIDRRLVTLTDAGLSLPAGVEHNIFRRLLRISDYAFERLRRNPSAVSNLDTEPDAPSVEALLTADGIDTLRRYRHALSLHILWREAGGALLEEVLAASTAQAGRCIQLALAAAEQAMAERHGWLRD